ncbi:MAG: molybdopterin-dependent oxidoreductase [Chloroflexota bacterium]
MSKQERNMMVMRGAKALFLSVVAFLLLAACQPAVEETAVMFPYNDVAAASLLPGDAIPAPADEVVLTIDGNIGVTNQGDALAFDMETLESLGLVSFNVYVPWQEERDSFTGVLLSDLLAAAGASEATEITVTAVDGYAPTIKLSDLGDYPVLVATTHRYEQLTPSTLGPTRLIFPYDTFPDMDFARNNSVWMIDTITVQ